MECQTCGAANAPGRRYCRECGGRLGEACSVCGFFNALADKHCGGCGRRLAREPGALAAAARSRLRRAPAFPEDEALDESNLIAPAAPPGVSAAGRDVSESEIDGLFENILGEETQEGGK
jgi:hypothetical protein